jgi:hypothetical protein
VKRTVESVSCTCFPIRSRHILISTTFKAVEHDFLDGPKSNEKFPSSHSALQPQGLCLCVCGLIAETQLASCQSGVPSPIYCAVDCTPLILAPPQFDDSELTFQLRSPDSACSIQRNLMRRGFSTHPESQSFPIITMPPALEKKCSIFSQSVL